METKKSLHILQKEALHSYLELCCVGEVIPEKILYDELANCNDLEKLNSYTVQIKSGLSIINATRVKREMEAKHKKSFTEKIINLFK